MIFSELYSAYYNAVARILSQAVEHPVSAKEMREIIADHAFDESVMSILPALQEGRWPLLRKDGTTTMKHAPTMPLTTLQKMWANAIAQDPRMQLFLAADEAGALKTAAEEKSSRTAENPSADDAADETTPKLPYPEVHALFNQKDYYIFDKYEDGDPYEEPTYREHFATALRAVREGRVLDIRLRNRHGEPVHTFLAPTHLEYSEKDDKFRIVGRGTRRADVINLARVERCEICEETPAFMRKNAEFAEALRKQKTTVQQTEEVEFELRDERLALDRVMMSFAHFEKQSERIGDRHYRVVLKYDKKDETEMVIRLISFGPTVKVTAPEHMVSLVKERIRKQFATFFP